MRKGKTKTNKNLVRLQFDFSPKEVEEIDKLVTEYNCSSRTELFRKMRKFFASIQDISDPNGYLTILSPSGEKVRFIF